MPHALLTRPADLTARAPFEEVRGSYRGVSFTNANRKAGGFRPDGWRILLSTIWFGSLPELFAEIDRMQAEGDPIIRAGRQEEPR